ncbi:SUKH-3 domain-containing protein [Hyalangium versicolor]|uniref:SUKH-3 domain-containing protein n=1 Tax=Hyalangium versicolor TaxID=2861190 RepID=UPI001CCF586C|nr:SUKH-3 domain-containing protein [Hyalangium versicolor]
MNPEGEASLPQWMSPLDKHVVARLHAAGWFPGRTVPMDAIKAKLEGAGYRVHALAEALLGTLGGLTLQGFEPRILKFGELPDALWVAAEEVPYVKKIFSDTVCPVALGAAATLFVSEDGTWWALDELWLGFFEMSGFDAAMRFILFGHREVAREIHPRMDLLPPSLR